jgi:hypothetical protein
VTFEREIKREWELGERERERERERDRERERERERQREREGGREHVMRISHALHLYFFINQRMMSPSRRTRERAGKKQRESLLINAWWVRAEEQERERERNRERESEREREREGPERERERERERKS